MKINKREFIGYLWMSDQTRPEMLPCEGELDTDAVANPFVVEGYLVDAGRSVSIRFADGRYMVNEYELSAYDDVPTEAYMANRLPGVSHVLFKRKWRSVSDTLCEGFDVLKPAELVFVGFKKQEEE